MRCTLLLVGGAILATLTGCPKNTSEGGSLAQAPSGCPGHGEAYGEEQAFEDDAFEIEFDPSLLEDQGDAYVYEPEEFIPDDALILGERQNYVELLGPKPISDELILIHGADALGPADAAGPDAGEISDELIEMLIGGADAPRPAAGSGAPRPTADAARPDAPRPAADAAGPDAGWKEVANPPSVAIKVPSHARAALGANKLDVLPTAVERSQELISWSSASDSQEVKMLTSLAGTHQSGIATADHRHYVIFEPSRGSSDASKPKLDFVSVDLATLEPELEPRRHSAFARLERSRPLAAARAAKPSLDILVLFTPRARVWVGEYKDDEFDDDPLGSVRKFQNLLQIDANDLFGQVSSDVRVRVRAARLETTLETKRSNIARTMSGTLDLIEQSMSGRSGSLRRALAREIHTQRIASEFEADVVVVVVNRSMLAARSNPTPPCGEALGILRPEDSAVSFDSAYAVVGDRCILARNSLLHEVGHLLGAAHDKEHADGPGYFRYSYAKGSCSLMMTLMSYRSENCNRERKLRFSRVRKANNARAIKHNLDEVMTWGHTYVSEYGAP